MESKIAIARYARNKGKEQKRTGQQGYSTQRYGVRDNRNPWSVLRESGATRSRAAERQ